MENVLFLLTGLGYTFIFFQLGRIYGRAQMKQEMRQDFLKKVNEFFRVPEGHIIDGVHLRKLDKDQREWK